GTADFWLPHAAGRSRNAMEHMSRITLLLPDDIGEVAASILRSWRCALLLGLIVAISVQCNAAPASEGYDDDGATVFEGNIFVSDGVKYTISGTEVYTSDIRNNGSIGDATNYSLFFDSDGLFGISSVTIEAEDGGSFRLTGLVFDGIADADITIATDAGGSVSYTSNSLLITQAVDASENAAFYNITSVTI